MRSSNVIKAYQLDVGHDSGQIPMINPNNSITIVGDPMSPTDVVNKKYVDHLFEQLSEATSFETDDIDMYKKATWKEINHICFLKRTNNKIVPPDLLDIYREKFDQSLDFLTYKDSIDNYPLIGVDSRVYGITPEEAAHNILNKKSAWLKFITLIEEIRLSYNKRVSDALSIPDIDRLRFFFKQELDNTHDTP